MRENTQDIVDSALEIRSRALFEESVDGLDFGLRSRLTQARHVAVAAARAPGRARLRGMPWWQPAAGVAAAVLLGVALWFAPHWGTVAANHAVTADSQTNLEDLDMVASSDTGTGDALEMLQDDFDFYDFADKAANAGPTA